MSKKLNTEDFVADWITNQPLQEAFEDNIYRYALYVCGGDFSLFDDIPLLNNYFSLLKVTING
jgi:hypothetical protein